MEKRNEWNIGDIVLCRSSNFKYKIVAIEEESNGISQIFTEAIDYNCHIDIRLVDPLIFMGKFWVNLGNSKCWEILYGKDSSNKLSNKG